jgi:hypothetical protein
VGKTIRHYKTDGSFDQWSGKQVGVSKVDDDGTVRTYKTDGSIDQWSGELVAVSKETDASGGVFRAIEDKVGDGLQSIGSGVDLGGVGGLLGRLLIFLLVASFVLLMACLVFSGITGGTMQDGVMTYSRILSHVRQAIIVVFSHSTSIVYYGLCVPATLFMIWRFKVMFPLLLLAIDILFFQHYSGHIPTDSMFVILANTDLQWGLFLGSIYLLYKVLLERRRAHD